MEADLMKRSLKHLGIQPSDYRVLKLLPLVYVAWADGKMSAVKKERIHSFALQNYDLSASGARVLNQWLEKQPAHAYIAEALDDILQLAKARDDMEVDFSELPGLLFHAENLATEAGSALGQEHASPEVEGALQEIAAALGSITARAGPSCSTSSPDRSASVRGRRAQFGSDQDPLAGHVVGYGFEAAGCNDLASIHGRVAADRRIIAGTEQPAELELPHYDWAGDTVAAAATAIVNTVHDRAANGA